MQLNKLGHGLAVSAVSALVVAGLSMGAAPASAAEGAGVRLISQQNGVASTRATAFNPYMQNTGTVTLTAERLDPGALITFEVNADPDATNDASGWSPINDESADTSGRFASVDWTPSTNLIGTDIALRAVATNGPTTTYSTRNGVALTGGPSAAQSVSLDRTSIFGGGVFFPQPYADSSRTASLMTVTGGTSAADGSVELSAWNPTSGAFEGTTQADVSFDFDKIFSPATFRGTLDISASGGRDGDVIAVRAQRDSDNVRPIMLEEQTISRIQVTGVDELAGPETTSVSLAVYDEADRGVIGAEVRRSSDGAVVGYTGDFGRLVVDQHSGTTDTYYANATDTDAYESEIDVISSPVVVPDYVPTAAATEADFADGTVFDDQEYADGDIALQVVDGRGDPYSAEAELSYALYPSDEEAPAEWTTGTTDEDGRLVVPFDPAGSDGEYTLAFTSPGATGRGEEEPVAFVAGDAVLGLSPLAGTAPSGGTISYEGTLTVEGLPLTGRDVDLTYARGTEQAPGTGADAGIVQRGQRALTATTTTDDDGTFTVTVGDEVEVGGPAESGGKLTVTVLGDTIDATADFTQVVTPTTPTDPPTTTPTPTPTPTTTPTPTPTPAPGKTTVSLRLTGSDAGPASDKLRVTGPTSVAGQKVRIHVRAPGGSWRAVEGVELDDTGDASLTLRDTNGDQVTRYRVRLVPNPVAKTFTSGQLRLR